MKKVSLVSPCYNGESHLAYFIESLLAQTYPNVEFIFVDDGSTDRTGEIFSSYQKRLEAKGWTVQFIRQENKGQAAAVNAGLKHVSGDYLIWPDSDDILYPEHIAKKAEFMEKNPSCGIGFCLLDKVNENNLDKIVGRMGRRPEKEDNLFEDLLTNNNILWPPIGSIVRMSAFDETNPQREIYEGRGGQNFQMMLPVASKYPAGYMNESLGKYVVRKSSHSKTKSDLLQQRHFNLLSIWINTIQNLHGVSEEVKVQSLAKACSYFDFVCPAVKKVRFLGIPLVSVVTRNNKKKVKLFGLLNIMTLVKRGRQIKGRLFGIFPFSVK